MSGMKINPFDFTTMEEAMLVCKKIAQTEGIPKGYQAKRNVKDGANWRKLNDEEFNALCEKKSWEMLIAASFGAEFELGFLQSLRCIMVANGVASFHSDAIPAVCMGRKGAGYIDSDVIWEGEGKDLKAICWVDREGRARKTREFSLRDAHVAGLLGKDTYAQYPADMLASKARARAFRAQFPDVLLGIFEGDEADAIRRTEHEAPGQVALTSSNSDVFTAAVAGASTPKVLPEPSVVVTLPKTEATPAAVEKVAAKVEAVPQAEQPVARQKKATEKPAPIAQVQPEPVKQTEPVPVVQTVQPADDELPGLEETKEELKQETVVAAPIPSPEVAPTGSSEYVKALKAITAATMEASVTSVVMQAMTSYKAGVLTRSEYQLLVKAGYLRRLGMDLTLQAIDGMLIMSQKADMTPEDALVVKIECITRLAIGASLLPLSDADRLKWENHIMEQIKSIQPTHQALVLRCIINTAPSIASLEARNEGSMVAASGSIKALLSGLNWLRDGRTENDTSRALGAAYKERLAALK